MTTPPPPGGYYPQQAYYAPGWQAPAGPPPPRRPWGRIVAGALLGVVLLVVAAVTIPLVARQLAVRPLGEVTQATEAGPRQLRPGHCLAALPDDGEVAAVTVVPCDERHEAEVVGLHTFDDEAWPGERQARRAVRDACEMDSAQTEAGARPVVWSPTQESWGQGDRLGVCLAAHPAGVVGSWTDDDEVRPAP